MLGSKSVLVIGTGTIGEPLIGLLCSTTSVPAQGTGEPVRGADPSGDGPAEEEGARAFLDRKYEEAKRCYKKGLYQAAYRISDAILVLDPDVSYRDDLRRLRRLAEGRYLGLSVLDLRFEMEARFKVLPEGHLVMERSLIRIHVGLVVKSIRVEAVEEYRDYKILD